MGQQKIKLLEDELSTIDEEISRLEMNHLETKIQLSEELRALMKRHDDIKNGKITTTWSDQGIKGSISDQSSFRQMKSALEAENEKISSFESEEKQIKEQILIFQQEINSITKKIKDFSDRIKKASEKPSQHEMIEVMEKELSKKENELESVKKAIITNENEIRKLQAKNVELDHKVTSMKRVLKITEIVDSFKSKTYVGLQPHEEAARKLWNGSLDEWYEATSHFASRDPLFFTHAYRAFNIAIKAYFFLFQERELKEEEDPELEEMLNYLYKEGFSIPSHLLEKIQRIAEKIDMGQDVIPLPPFWDKVFDFLRKNMKMLRIEDPSVNNL
ncbi:MAG: hypothetical protein ACXAEU_01060 [Candidatus Hodarchaeales archaeon]|jgi:DNA repair exonuclease SbcCD ATPase subunit